MSILSPSPPMKKKSADLQKGKLCTRGSYYISRLPALQTQALDMWTHFSATGPIGASVIVLCIVAQKI